MDMLVDLIPAKQRKYVYAALSILVAVYGVWQAVDGNWGQFFVSLVTTLVGTMATANTNVSAGDQGEATTPTLEDRVGAGEKLDQTGEFLAGGRHAAPDEEDNKW